MSALLKEQVLDDEGLTTLMCEVESIVNGRPLTKVSNDTKPLSSATFRYYIAAWCFQKGRHVFPLEVATGSVSVRCFLAQVAQGVSS